MPKTKTTKPEAPLVSRLDLRRVVVKASLDGAVVSVALAEGDEVVIGSAASSGLRVDDPSLSARHASVVYLGDNVRVVDLGSREGVFFDAIRLQDAVLPVGAHVMLGRASVTIEAEEAGVLSTTSGPPLSRFGGLVGADPRTRELFATLKDVASSEATVIIEGETGTGKEVVAQAIHEASSRSKGPFVVFDCGAVPKDLIESALFGHVKGAFTGATDSRAGVFKRASLGPAGGTIFLDEIGELPVELQPRLLRVLETRTVQPVGGDDPQRINVRVLCATHRSLRGDIKTGRFREDLYYRLAVVKVRLPPLRDRKDDIAVIAQHFAEMWAAERSESPRRLDPRGLELIHAHPFPGNVRQLRNLVERALALAPPGAIDLSRFLSQDFTDTHSTTQGLAPAKPTTVNVATEARGDSVRAAAIDALDPGRSFRDAKAMVNDAFERVFIGSLLEQNDHNLSRAAVRAQMDRKHLRDLGRRHGLLVRDDDPPTTGSEGQS